MLDCSSAGRMEKEPLSKLAERWLPQGLIAHVQVNDRNRQGPGQGEQKFAPLFAALLKHGYAGDIAVVFCFWGGAGGGGGGGVTSRESSKGSGGRSGFIGF